VEVNVDYLVFLRTLTTEQRKLLTQRSNRYGLQYLALHMGVLLLCGYLIVHRAPFWPLIMVLHGVLLVFLFTLMHETVHKTAFASRTLNQVIGQVCGLLLFQPAEWFRYFHLAHHRHTQNPTKDPELASPKPATRWQYIKCSSMQVVDAGMILCHRQSAKL